MGPFAVNRFTITKSLFYEGMLRVIRTDLGPFIKKVLIALAALWAVLAAVTLLTKASPSYAIVELVVLAAVALWLCVYIPRNRARQAWKALESRSGGDMERVTSFFDDRLEIDSGAETTVIPYADVLQTLPTEHLLVLTCKEKVGVLIARDGFMSGELSAVQARIEQAADSEQSDAGEKRGD